MPVDRRVVQDPFPVGRNRWVAMAAAAGELDLITAVPVHAPNLKGAGAVRYEDDITVIGGDGGVVIHRGLGRQLSLPRAVRPHLPKVLIAAGFRRIDQAPVWRPTKMFS